MMGVQLKVVVVVVVVVGVMMLVDPAVARRVGYAHDQDEMHPNSAWSDGASRSRRTSNEVQNTDWMATGKQGIQEALNVNKNIIHKRPKNVILFIADGLGISTTTATRLYNYQTNHDTVAEAVLSYEKLPHVGLSLFYSVDSMSPDSACTGTALLTGEKTRLGIVGLGQNTDRGSCSSQTDPNNELRSFVMRAQDVGKAVGIVSNTRITHATPGAAYAHAADRYWESDADLPDDATDDCWDIAKQLVYREDAAKVKLFMGGGRAYFMPNNMSDPEYSDNMGKREDNEDLINTWLNKRKEEGMAADTYAYVWNKTALDELDFGKTDKLLALFEPSHMRYENEKNAEDEAGEPTWSQLVETAIEYMSKYEEGYTLMIESGRIDHAHHDTKANKAIDESMMLHQGIQQALDLTDHDDTLIMLTSDHSTPITVSGYSSLDSPIRGTGDNLDLRGEANGLDNKPSFNLNYVHGPAFFDHRYTVPDGEEEPEYIDEFDLGQELQGRRNPAEMEATMNDVEFRHDAAIPARYEAHSGEEVAIYAIGPMAHLIHGVHEQTYVGHVLMYAQCLEPYNTLDMCPPVDDETASSESRETCGAASVRVSGSCVGAVVVWMWVVVMGQL